ncbi:MAG: hypothetical protein KDA24_28150 [Deltaproteobacteria bacterium]|nr:hypothetical protein [Deltaproteobacteria bacterium]
MVPPYDDIDSRDGTWMSLSLDAEAEDRSGPQRLGETSGVRLLTPAPPQPPPRSESSAGDSPAPTLREEPSVIVAIEDGSLPTAARAGGGEPGGDSVSIDSTGEGSLDSASLDSASLDGDSGEIVTEHSAVVSIVEEVTEAVEVPVPAPLLVTLEDEVMPWPPLLVAPTLVLPGAWPPPPGTLARSQPSIASLLEEPSSKHEELSIELELELDDESVDSELIAGLGDSLEPSLSVEVVIEDDPSVADVSVVERLINQGRPLEPDRDDDIPTEVSERDALEEALAVLRSAKPGTVLTPLPEPEPDPEGDDAAVTAEDLVSLELVDEGHGPVNPAVRTDLDLAPVATPVWDRTWISTGAPTLARHDLGVSRAWVQLVLEPPPPPIAVAPKARGGGGFDEPISEHSTDLRALAEQRERAGTQADGLGPFVEPSAARTDDGEDDWLSDLPDDET